MLVVLSDIAFNAIDQLAHVFEGSTSDSLLCDQAKPALHLIEPARIGRREVHVIPRVFGQPCLDLRVLMRSVVIDDQMHVKFRRNRLINVLQKGQKLLMPMTRLALCDDRGGAASSDRVPRLMRWSARSSRSGLR